MRAARGPVGGARYVALTHDTRSEAPTATLRQDAPSWLPNADACAQAAPSTPLLLLASRSRLVSA